MNMKKLSPVLIAFIVILSLFSTLFYIEPVVAEGENWWNSSWGYRKLITLNTSQVPATMTNFPVCINLSSDSNLSSYAQDNGDDICFIDFYDNSTQFKHEVEYFNGSTGRLVAWVNDTTLSSTNYKIWMYYNNSACSDQSNVNDTWNSDYMMVHHFHETPGDGSSFNDSTSNDNDGTWTNPTSQGDNNESGLFYNCIQFEDANSDNYIDLGSQTGFSSVSFWFNCPSRSLYDFLIAHNDLRVYLQTDSGNIRFSDGSSHTIDSGYNADLHYNEWIHIVAVSNGVDSRLYVNNAKTTTLDTFDAITSQATNIGRWTGDTHYGDNIIEEVQVYTNVLSDDDVEIIYNSQKNATDGGFFSLGSEESSSFSSSVNTISPYEQTSSTLALTASSSGSPDNVTLWYRWSDDNSSWDGGTDSFGNDTVDSNSSDVGSPTDVGSHSNFNNQKNKDGTYDTLTEEDNSTAGNYVNDTVDSNTSDIDSSEDIGNETSFSNCQDISPDSDYMNIQENNTGSGATGYFGDTTQYTYQHHIAENGKEDFEKQYGRKISCNVNCNVDNISAYLTTSSTSAVNIKYAIYTGDGTPETIITNGETNQGTLSASGTEWVTCSFATSPTLSTGTDYYLVVLCDWSDIGNVKDVHIFGEETGSNGTIYSTQNIYPTSFAFDTSWTSSEYTLDSSAELSIYCNYTETGGGNNYELDFEYQWTSADNDETNEYVCFEVDSHTGNDNLNVSYWAGSSWVNLGFITGIGWSNFTATGLTASTYTIRLNSTADTSDTTQDDWDIDVMKLYCWSPSNVNYGLDLEVQWTGLNFNHQVEQLCIYTGTQGAEALEVDVWSGSGWDNLITDLSADAWNNVSITSYLTGSTLTIRYKGDVEASDTTQHTWQIDFARVHYHNTSGGSHGITWQIWSDASNPDTGSPWAWTFNYPNSTGYYEFYSIAKKSGESDESAPGSKDAMCHYTSSANSDPVLTSNSCSPTSGVALYTVFYFNVTWTDTDNDDPTGSGAYLKVNISRSGWDTNQTMLWISGANNTGALYSYNTDLTAGDYTYKIWACDGNGGYDDATAVEPSVSPQSLSFTITKSSPGSDQFDFKDWTLTLTGVGLTSEYNVSEDNQTINNPAINITNTGNVPLNFSINWTASPGSGISMKWGEIFGTPPNPGVNILPVAPSEEWFILNLEPTDYKEIFLWMDFVSVGAGSGSQVVRITSYIYSG